jgi:hypothetical protein
VTSEWLGARVADLIVSLSFFALGVLLYLSVFVNVPAAIRAAGHERLLEASYAAARLGTVLVIGLVTEAVFRANSVPLQTRTYLYIAGLLLLIVGYLGVVVEGKKVRRRDK